MAFINPDDHGGSGAQLAPDSIQNHTTTAQNIVISPMGLTEVPLPGGGFVTNAVMTQEGGDLILESPDGITLVIEGYFSGDSPPNLISDGKVLTPALVKSFIQASTDYAEDKVAMNDATPVGEAHEVSGHATVTHLNGSTETIVKGTAIYEGDVVETDAKGAVNIQFVDESSFAVSNNAKMAIDEFVYDSTTHGGENNFSMLRGLFVYTSGLVGREDPDDVKIETPVGSIGIRGTIITGSLPAEGSAEPAKISVVEGAIVITGHDGRDVTLSQQFETVQIDANGMKNVGVMPQTEMSQTFNVLRTVAPTLFSAMEEAQGEDKPGQDAPADAAPVVEDTAAPTTDDQSQPQDAPVPEAPAPMPDVIQLNLLPGALDPVTMNKAIASNTFDLTYTAAMANLSLQGIGALPPATATSLPSISLAPSPSENTTATTPAVVDPGTGSNAGPGTGTPPINHAPVANVTTYAVLEQAGHAGGTHTFYINHLFSDQDPNDNLTYTVTTVSDPNNLVSLLAVDGAGSTTFILGSTVPAGVSTIVFSAVATDGSLTSTPVTLTVQVYSLTQSYDATDNTVNLTTGSNRIDTESGSDNVTISSANNVVFGGADDDSIAILSGSSGNKVYGDTGNDSLNILGGTNNTVAGGVGNDQISVSLTTATDTFMAFGGGGEDKITIGNAAALTSLRNGLSVIDGGAGFDTLVIGPSVGNVDLRTIPNSAIMGVEKIQLAATGGAMITLDIADLFASNPDHALFIDISGTNSLTLTNTSGQGNLVATGTTITDNTGEVYNVYNNGTNTLYLNVDATAGNVSGVAI